MREFYELFAPEIFGHKPLAVSTFLATKEIDAVREIMLERQLSEIALIFQCAKCTEHASFERLRAAVREEDDDKLIDYLHEFLPELSMQWSALGFAGRDGAIAEIMKRRALYRSLLNDGFYYDLDAYRMRLREKLGEDTKVGHSLKPIALFAAKSELTVAEEIIMALRKVTTTCGFMPESSSPFIPSHTYAFSTQDVSIVDAVLASSAGPVLFPPVRITIEGIPYTFTDGDCGEFSTLLGMVNEARRLWPNANLEVFSLSVGFEIEPSHADDQFLKVCRIIICVTLSIP